MGKFSNSTPFILEKAADQAAVSVYRYRVPMLSSLIFGLLSYGFFFTNKLINHDEVYSLFSKGGTVVSGRWVLGFLDTIFPNYSMPWIYGIFTVFLIAIGICILTSILDIRNRLLQGLLAGCVMVFPSLIGLFGYMFTSCSFALSFLLSILSVYLLQTNKKCCILPACACLILSMGIYQSYISVAAGLLILVLIQRLLNGAEPVSILKQGIGYVIFLMVSMAGYYLCTQAILRVMSTELVDYASDSLTFRLGSIASNAVLAYKNFFRFFTEGFCGLIPTAFCRLLHGIVLVITAGLLLLVCRAKKYAPGTLILLAALILVLPLAINCMYMITAEDSIHTLVLYGFINIYLFMLLLAELVLKLPQRKNFANLLLNGLTGILAVVIACNIYLANQASLHLYLRYENTYAFYTALASELKMQPEFTENTKLAIVGDYQQPEYYSKHFKEIQSITGIYGFVPTDYSKQRFMEYYLGLSIPFASSKQITEIKTTSEFAQMPVYPYYGSMKSIGDFLVVKLS